MAVRPTVVYPGRTTAPNTSYPDGGAQNITSPGDGQGTPWEQLFINDVYGWQQALTFMAGVTPSGSSETALNAPLNSDYLSSMLRLMTYADVRGFGAVGDGVANDTVPIQAALDAAAVSGGGVLIPKGTYSVNKLTVASGVTLIGGGGTLKLRDSSNTSLVEIVVGSEKVYLLNLVLDGNSGSNATSPSGSALIDVQSSSGSPTKNVWIDKCFIMDADQNGISLVDGCQSIHISASVIDGIIDGSGIEIGIGGSATDISIRYNNILNTAHDCILASGSLLSSEIIGNNLNGSTATSGSPLRASVIGNDTIIVSGNQMIEAFSHAIHIQGLNLKITENILFDFKGDGIRIQSDTTPQISSYCVIANNTITGDVAALEGLFIENGAHISISGNTIRKLTGNAIALHVGSTGGTANTTGFFSIIGNSIGDSLGFIGANGILIDTPASGFGIIDSNRINSIIGDGILFDSVAGGQITDTIVSNNRISTPAGTGIREAVGEGDFNMYIGNNVRSSGTGITESGAGNLVANNLT